MVKNCVEQNFTSIHGALQKMNNEQLVIETKLSLAESQLVTDFATRAERRRFL